jgi:ribosomal protein S27AE
MKVVSLVIKLIGGSLLFGGLLFLAGTGWSGYHRYVILERWQQVDATVTQCRMNSRQETYRDSDDHRTTTTTIYTLELAFRYTVAGRDYTTPAKSPFGTNLDSVMRRQTQEYAVGTHHSIRYNPHDPNQIRYDVGWNVGFLMTPVVLGILGVVLTLLGGGILVFARKLRARPCPRCGLSVPASEPQCPHCGAFMSSPIMNRAA